MPASTALRRRLRRAAPLVAIAAAGVLGGAAVEGARDAGTSAATPVAAVAAGAGGGPSAVPIAATSTADAATIYARAAQGVVDIEVTGTSASAGFGPQQATGGEGTGVVLDEQGDIVTNAHVVDGATSITVVFADGARGDATLVGTDTASDLAVIRVEVDAGELEPLALASGDDVTVGESVLAIGSPFGYAGTLTAGIVSAVDRVIESPDGTAIGGAIQTDAAINPGNSGGPLLDASGTVIGINAQISSESGGNEGVGFAIPASTVCRVTSALIAGETVQHPRLGVRLGDGDGGPTVAEVTTGSAGVEVGDVIAAIDGSPVASADALAAAIAAHAVGDRVQLTVERDGASRTLTATLEAAS